MSMSMSEAEVFSMRSSSPMLSECETVSSSQSRSPSPACEETLFMPAATIIAGLGSADPFQIRYEQPRRSAEFWFEDGSAVIEVENTWYNVHGSILKRQSKFFKENLPTSTNKFQSSPGSVRQPLVLEVSKKDFELLLSLIYPSDFWSRHAFTVEEWFGIANAATALEFPTIRKAALENIYNKCGAVDLIVLGRKHVIPDCISSGFRVLCFKDEPLSLEDGQNIGMYLVIQIARAREMLAKGKKWSELESDFVYF